MCVCGGVWGVGGREANSEIVLPETVYKAFTQSKVDVGHFDNNRL